MDEADVIARIARRFRGLIPAEALGLVDDAALVPRARKGARLVMSSDQMNEGVHFLVERGGSESAGWRAIVRNLSDLAAMGARPVGFQWTLALPARWLDDGAALFDAFLRGAARACRRYALPMLGGDVTKSAGGFACSVAILGDVAGKPLLRSGARAGHRLFVSRPLGASSRGLALLLAGGARRRSAAEQRAVRAHLFPSPELALGASLVGSASACIDVSDGLALDLHRLARASGVAIVVDRERLGAASATADVAHALHGGDDYALAFTLPRRVEAPRGALLLGHAVRGAGVVVEQGGVRMPLAARGYDHFARASAS